MSEHLAEVAAALHGAGTLRAATWFADQKHALLREGPTPLLVTLAAGPALAAAAAEVVRRNLGYFTEHAARLDYPTFLARHFPIGSGAIESACTLLITQREKRSGLRWSPAGAQQTANRRALYRSAGARWATFWASRPLTRARRLAPPVPFVLATAPPPAAQAPDSPPVLLAHTDTPAQTRIATADKPWAKGKDYGRRRPLPHPRSA